MTPAKLSDRELLDATERLAGDERRTTAELLALLAELDTRKLYLGEGYSSLFSYCTQRLHLSESAAYSRITAARAARQFPILFGRLAAGDMTLTSICLLAGHLTKDNHEALLDAARYSSRRDVERLVASLHTQPDISPSVRRLPSHGLRHAGLTVPGRAGEPVLALEARSATELATPELPRPPILLAAASRPPEPAKTAPRPVVAPLSAHRYLLRVTIGAPTQAKLERARGLLRHAIPDGDLAAILDRALNVLVDQLERRKLGRVARPSGAKPGAKGARGRHVPAAVKRVVWTRDQGQCAFMGSNGRCGETAFLEYHHIVPYASGGPTAAGNLELRCRAHNAYEAALRFSKPTRQGQTA